MSEAVLAGRYRMLSALGSGGMGEVHLAEDVQLQRRVAVKVLPASAEADPVARERLRREALAAAALDHPFICKVHEIGDEAGRLFIVMEFVEGETLHASTRGGLLPMRQVIDIAHELAQALDAAHRRSIVHRDLKPANVMLTPQGHVKVMDFGLAKHLEKTPSGPGAGGAGSSGGARAAGAASDAGTRLTDAGTRLGTPAYMSPEQVLGASLDPRSDVFSLGVILHELAAGAHPFLQDSPADTMAAILRDPPRSGSRDLNDVPGFGDVVGRMLAKACAGRHQTMAEVLADVEALRERAWSSSSRAGVPLAAPPAERTPFVGRDSEAAELERALDRMLTGQGGFVLVGGEPGVGKTRLARELLAKARQRGCVCFTGHCYEMEGAPPFVPFVEIIEQTVRLVPQAARAAMGELAAEIAAMVPNLRRTYSDIPPLSEVPADQQRRLMFSAFLEYMQRGTLKSPGVFLFDDLHWADEPTLQLLQYVAPHIASMRLLVVGTYRDVELDVKRPFAKTLEALLRQRLATKITLRRLNESGVQQMLAAMSGSAPPSGLAKAVFHETEGNPFFVEEVYQHLAEEGKLFDESGAWQADLRLGAIDVPEGVRLVIGRRLDRLGEQARRALAAASVIGRTFPLDLLQAIVDLPEDDVLDAVEEAERAQLVAADVSQRTPRYGFVHELIRTTLTGGLSLPRRQRLHLKIADAIERLRASSLDSHASVFAHHLYQAGAAADLQRTAGALMVAGRRALAAGAFEEALETFDNLIGLELGEQDPLVAEAYEHRGDALIALGRHDESTSAFERGLALFSRLHDDAGIERTARGWAAAYMWRGRFSEGVPPLKAGLKALSKGAARERAQLLAGSAAARMSPAYIDEAAGYLAEAMEIAEGFDDPLTLSHVLFGQAACQRMWCEYESATTTCRRALALLPPTALWERADALANLITITLYRGHFEECDRLRPEIVAAAEPAGHLGGLFLARWLGAIIACARTGDLRTFRAEGTQLLADLPYFPYITRSGAGFASLYLGDVSDALEQLTLVQSRLPQDNWYEGMPDANLVAAHALAGMTDRARALVPQVGPKLPSLGRRNVLGEFYALDGLVMGLALLGDHEQRASLYPLTLEYVRTGHRVSSVVVGPSSPPLAAALAADAAGLADKAREHFETALGQAHEIPVRILEPTVQYWYGRTLSASAVADEQSRGRAMLEAALTDFRRFEMVLHAGLAERALGHE